MSSLKKHFDDLWARRDLSAAPARGGRAEVAAPLLAGGGWLVDLGAGRGALAALTRGKFARVVALELAARPLAVARTDGALPVLADFSEAPLPFASASLDAVACLSALQYADDPRTTLAECYRVLRPGGQLALILPNMRTAIRILKLAALGRFPTVSNDPGYDGGTRHYFCFRDVAGLLAAHGFRVRRRGGHVPRPAAARWLPESSLKSEFFCAEMVVLAEKPR